MKHKVLVALLVGFTASAAGCSHSKEGLTRPSRKGELNPGTPTGGPPPEPSPAKAERERREASEPGRPDPRGGGRGGGSGASPQ